MSSLKSMKYAGTITSRLFSIQHDGWSSISSNGYLGIIVNFIHICEKRGWMLSKLTLGCIPFDTSHTAKATLDLANSVLKQLGLSQDDIISSTQDNASASFNTFATVDEISQLPCISHTAQLFIMHTVENVSKVNDAINNIQAVCVILRGNNSNDRVREIKRCCEAVGIKYLKVRLYGKTRWNSKELMIRRFILLLPAIELFDEMLIADSDKRNEFLILRSQAKRSIKFAELALPLMSWIAGWTQILSSNHTSNIGMVRLFCKRLQSFINTLSDQAEEYRRSQNLSITNVCDELYDNAQDQFNAYFDKDFHDFWIYRFAEYFDCRTYGLIPNANRNAEKIRLKNEFIDHFTTEKENTSPYVFYQRHGKTMDGDSLPEGEDDADFLNDVSASAVTPEYLPKNSLLTEEMSNYERLQKSVVGQYADPLQFWTDHHSKFPILSRIARVILSIPVLLLQMSSACFPELESQ